MCVWRVIRLTIYLLVIMVSLACAREVEDKRAPEDRQSWFMGSRYGRSSSGSGGGAGNTRHLIVTPRRDDRFHPGSRYGKRTMGTALTDEIESAVDIGGGIASNSGSGTSSQNVQCSYTGIADLYRCHVHVRKENTSGEFLAN